MEHLAWEDIPNAELGETPDAFIDQNPWLYRLITVKRALSKGYGEEAVDDPVVVIIDILADLRHLCDALRENFAELDKEAYSYYAEEKYDLILRSRRGRDD